MVVYVVLLRLNGRVMELKVFFFFFLRNSIVMHLIRKYQLN